MASINLNEQAKRIVRGICSKYQCVYAKRDGCGASRSAEDIVGDIRDGKGCAVAAKATEGVIIQLQPGIMTESRFTPLDGLPVNAKEHLGNCRPIEGGRVVFQYPT